MSKRYYMRSAGFEGSRGGLVPSDLSGLVSWHDAGMFVYTDDGITLATATQTVQRWDDRRGNGINLLQTTAGFKPTFQVNVLNGKPAVRFAGTDDNMSAVIADMPQPYSTVFVTKVEASASGSKTPVGFGNTTVYMNVNEQVGYFAGTARDSAVTINDAYRLITAVFNGASSFLRTQGATVSTANPGANASGTVLFVGSNDTPAEYITGDVVEVLVYNHALLLGSEVVELERYLNTKYQLGATV